MATRRDFLRTLALALPGAGLLPVWAAGATAKTALPDVDLDFIASKMTLLRKASWTDMAPKHWRLRPSQPFDRATVHHTGESRERDTARNSVVQEIDAICAGHRERGYGDIGYHFVVDYAGRVWEGRSLAYEGAHVRDQNRGNIGIVVLGNFERQRPLGDQLEAMRILVGVLRAKYGIKKHRVYGHRDIGASACPGKNLYPAVAGLRS